MPNPEVPEDMRALLAQIHKNPTLYTELKLKRDPRLVLVSELFGKDFILEVVNDVQAPDGGWKPGWTT